MKLLRYGPPGREKPGMLDSAGRVRDLSTHIADIAPAALGPEALARLRALDPEKLPLVAEGVRLGSCLAQVSKIIGIGKNYVEHAEETGASIPKEPILFMKATTALNGPDDPIMLPKGSAKTDWEVELGVVIGTTARYVTVHEALNHVAGYCLVNDVSEREFQKERGGQWDKGKSADGFCPCGPYLVTKDEIPDPQALFLTCEVNGRLMQNGNTRDMIFPIAHLISYVSHFMTLLPGDLIATGTPAGVGAGMKPPVFLRPGDDLVLTGQDLGRQTAQIIAFRPERA